MYLLIDVIYLAYLQQQKNWVFLILNKIKSNSPFFKIVKIDLISMYYTYY